MQTHSNPTNTAINGDIASMTLEQLEALVAKKRQEQSKSRDDYKETVAHMVEENLLTLKSASKMLSEAKTLVFSDINTLLSLKKEVYGTSGDKSQQSWTFSTDSGSIVAGYRMIDDWDDSYTAGIEKVKEFVNSLAKDEDSANLAETLLSFIKSERNGKLKSQNILDLKKMADKVGSATLTDGVNIIIAAKRPKRSAMFVEASIVDESGNKEYIPLSISSVDFKEKDMDLSGFF